MITKDPGEPPVQVTWIPCERVTVVDALSLVQVRNGLGRVIVTEDAPTIAPPVQLNTSVPPGVVAPTGSDASYTAGEWNRYMITCKGSKITVNLNGAVVSEADLDPRPVRIRTAVRTSFSER